MSAMHRERTFKEELPAHRDLGYSRTKITFTALTSTRTESPFFTPRSARVSSVMTEVISIGPSTLTLTWLIREPFLISATFPTTLFRAPYFMQPPKRKCSRRTNQADDGRSSLSWTGSGDQGTTLRIDAGWPGSLNSLPVLVTVVPSTLRMEMS